MLQLLIPKNILYHIPVLTHWFTEEPASPPDRTLPCGSATAKLSPVKIG